MAKRPSDANQLAKLILDISVGEVEDTVSVVKRLGKRKGRPGGLKGGKVRAKRLTPEERTDIARIAATARWKKSKN
jgi:hypothetical protein